MKKIKLFKWKTTKRQPKVRDEITRLEENKTNNSFSERPVIQASDIQAIIEEKTGIPVGRLQEDEQSKMKNLESNLTGKVIGQEDAVRKVAKAIRRSRVGLKSKNRPIGSFLFVGPTGVGKTELGRTLARELFGTSEAMIRLDMSEFMEKHSVSKINRFPSWLCWSRRSWTINRKSSSQSV